MESEVSIRFVRNNMKLLGRINLDLLPLKICMLLWWGGNNALLSYTAVHMTSLGLNVWQVGLVHTLIPVTQVSGQISCGLVADRFRRHKIIILVVKTCAVCLLTAISFIPAIREDAGGFSNAVFTFYMYLCLRLLYELCSSTAFNLYETIAVLKVRQFPKANFGTQRFFASLGAGTIPGLSGFIMDAYAVPGGNLQLDIFANSSLNNTLDQQGSVTNFNILFYSVDCLILISVIVLLVFVNLDYKAIKVEYEVDAEDETPNLKTLLNIAIKPNAFVFILTAFSLGTCWGFTKIFVPWRMAELGSEKFLIGVCPLLSTAVGLFLILFSDRIFRAFGHVPVMIFAFVLYSTRFLGYSLLTSAKYFLIFEALEGFTYHFLWIAMVTYAALLTPAALTASVQGFMSSVHYSVGIGISGLIGGATISGYGAEIAFRGMSVASLLCSIAAGLFYVCYSRRRPSIL